MEAYLILIHIVLFSSDNTYLDNKAEVESCQTYYMLFLHRYIMVWWVVVVCKQTPIQFVCDFY